MCEFDIVVEQLSVQGLNFMVGNIIWDKQSIG